MTVATYAGFTLLEDQGGVRQALAGLKECTAEEAGMAIAISALPQAGFVAKVADSQLIVLCLFVGGAADPSCLMSVLGQQSIDGDAVILLRSVIDEAQQRLGGKATIYIQAASARFADSSSRLVPHRALATLQFDGIRPPLTSSHKVREHILDDDAFWLAFQVSQPQPKDCFDRHAADVRAWSAANISGRTLFTLSLSANTGEIMGTVLPYMQNGIGWCEGVSVVPSGRRQKVASTLIDAAIGRLRDSGAQTIRANIDRMTNPAALALFQKLGFLEISCVFMYRLR